MTHVPKCFAGPGPPTPPVVVLARDSKDPNGPVLGFGAGAWGAFLDAVKSGRLDFS